MKHFSLKCFVTHWKTHPVYYFLNDCCKTRHCKILDVENVTLVNNNDRMILMSSFAEIFSHLNFTFTYILRILCIIYIHKTNSISAKEIDWISLLIADFSCIKSRYYNYYRSLYCYIIVYVRPNNAIVIYYIMIYHRRSIMLVTHFFPPFRLLSACNLILTCKVLHFLYHSCRK